MKFYDTPATGETHLTALQCHQCGRQSHTLYVSHTTGECIHCSKAKGAAMNHTSPNTAGVQR